MLVTLEARADEPPPATTVKPRKPKARTPAK